MKLVVSSTLVYQMLTMLCVSYAKIVCNTRLTQLLVLLFLTIKVHESQQRSQLGKDIALITLQI